MFRNHRNDFPTLSGENAPVYLDNACMTLRPTSVIEAIRSYYEESPGCGGRSVHRYATAVSRKMVNCRNNLGKLFNANESNEIIFTKNATHSLNQVAKGLKWEKNDVILTTDREHNSNLIPWLQLEEEQGVDHRVVKSNDDNTFNIENFENACAEAGRNLKMVSLSHVGNLDGIATPVKEVAKIAKDHGALVCIDGAQSTPHMKVDVQDLGIDFMAFSLHKMGTSSMVCSLHTECLISDCVRVWISLAHSSSTSCGSHSCEAYLPSWYDMGFSSRLDWYAHLSYLVLR